MGEGPPQVDQWLHAARAGSEDALGRLLQGCRNYLLLIAHQEIDTELVPRGGASDLVQETFLEAKRDFSQFRGTSEAEVLGWLRQILVHNLASFARRQHAAKREVAREVALARDDSARLSGPPLPDPGRTPSSEAIEREQAGALRRALDRLPPDYRQVIELRYLDGRSFDQIGRDLGRTADAVRKLWARAMHRLREVWEGPS